MSYQKTFGRSTVLLIFLLAFVVLVATALMQKKQATTFTSTEKPGNISGITPDATDIPAISEVTFLQVHVSEGMGFQHSLFPDGDFVQVISDMGEMKKIWQSLAIQTQIPIEKAAFEKQVALLIMADQKGSLGYSMSVDAVLKPTNDMYTVLVTETQPGYGCKVSEALSRPYLIILAPKLGATQAILHKSAISNPSCVIQQ